MGKVKLEFIDDFSTGVHPGFVLPDAKRTKRTNTTASPMLAVDYLRRKQGRAAIALNRKAATLVQAWKQYKRKKYQKCILNAKYIQTGFEFWDDVCDGWAVNEERNPYLEDWTTNNWTTDELQCLVPIMDMIVAVNYCGDDRKYHEVLNPLHKDWYDQYMGYLRTRWELDTLQREEAEMVE